VRTGHYFITQMHPVGERSSTAPNDSGHGDVIESSGETQGHLQEPFETFILSSLPNRFTYRTPYSSGTCILTTSLLCDTTSHVCLHVAPLDILWKRMNRQASYFSYIRILAYANLGCVDRSPSTALVTTHLMRGRCLVDSRTGIA